MLSGRFGSVATELYEDLSTCFISYSRRDNERGQVAAIKTQIESSFHGMDDWRQKIQQSLRDSQVFLAVLSPNYLASPYCRWEWEDYVRYEAMRRSEFRVYAAHPSELTAARTA